MKNYKTYANGNRLAKINYKFYKRETDYNNMQRKINVLKDLIQSQSPGYTQPQDIVETNNHHDDTIENTFI